MKYDEILKLAELFANAFDNDPGQIFFDNYDYGGPEEATKTSPGRGLYNGKMNKHKSVADFIKKKRKRKRAMRKKALLALLSS